MVGVGEARQGEVAVGVGRSLDVHVGFRGIEQRGERDGRRWNGSDVD